MRTITSSGSRMSGSGTFSTRTSRLPCQATAFTGLARRLLVDPGLEHAAGGDLREELVGLRLLVERLIHQVPDAVEAAVVGELPRCAVGGDLVMLDALRRADQGCVAGHRVATHADHLLALGDETLHPLANLGRHRDAELAKGFLDATHMATCLVEVVLERVAELLVMRGLGHLRERTDELSLGAVQIFELLLQDVFERMESHVLSPFESDFRLGVPRLSKWQTAEPE